MKTSCQLFCNCLFRSLQQGRVYTWNESNANEWNACSNRRPIGSAIEWHTLHWKNRACWPINPDCNRSVHCMCESIAAEAEIRDQVSVISHDFIIILICAIPVWDRLLLVAIWTCGCQAGCGAHYEVKCMQMCLRQVHCEKVKVPQWRTHTDRHRGTWAHQVGPSRIGCSVQSEANGN